jgi:hypothetical protein
MFGVFVNERLQRRQDYFDQEVEEINKAFEYVIALISDKTLLNVLYFTGVLIAWQNPLLVFHLGSVWHWCWLW